MSWKRITFTQNKKSGRPVLRQRAIVVDGNQRFNIIQLTKEEKNLWVEKGGPWTKVLAEHCS